MNMYQEMIKKGKCSFSEFEKILTEHKEFEEESIYPKLDSELNDYGKKIIIQRINEIL